MSDDTVLGGGTLVEDAAEPPKSRARNAVEWVVIVVGALLVALVVKTFLLQAFYIPSLSMSPTLKLQDRVLVNKLSYDLHDINRGDVVVFRSPKTNDPGEIKDLIKRVVGLPGETIESRDGRMLVDGAELSEPYLAPGVEPGPPVERQVIPEGHLFVMGDNRSQSKDSRSFGPIPESLVVGRAFVKVWPITDLGLL